MCSPTATFRYEPKPGCAEMTSKSLLTCRVFA
ncbi:Uncharacterised protein [Mycobacteroides abscessus subsp. abscessus]|nr:Uncharacterised protein [Mycobacteroides abscessus subsp. abscessus]